MDRDQLFDHLDNNTQVLKNAAVRDAFEAVDRADFVGEDYAVEAYEDYSLPTVLGQLISKPTVAAFMLELLDARKGDTVLEIGTGSGWLTALLSHIVGPEGSVTSVEIVPELVDLAKRNLEKYDAGNVRIVTAGKDLGSPEGGPYSRIVSTASSEELPQALVGQLGPGGIMVVPVRGSIVRIAKLEGGRLHEETFPGVFRFSELRER